MWAEPISAEVKQRAKQIKLVVFDVDGVLTQGGLLFLANGEEVKQFNTLDGLGIKLLSEEGFSTAIITGRSSPQVEKRAQALGIKHLIQGREDKLAALQELWAITGFSAQETAYMGDDWPDLAAIETVALGATVQQAHPDLVAAADWQSSRCGGQGAAREFCELLLEAQDKRSKLLERYQLR